MPAQKHLFLRAFGCKGYEETDNFIGDAAPNSIKKLLDASSGRCVPMSWIF